MALLLAACATGRPPASPPPFAPPPGPVVEAPPEPVLPPEPARRIAVRDLAGWDQEDHAAAFRAFRETCQTSRTPALADVCRRARAAGPLGEAQARRFLEDNFDAERVGDSGMLTAYFAPEYPARRAPDGEFTAPVLAKPDDLMVVDGGLFDPAQSGKPGAARYRDGAFEPYPDRAGVEADPRAPALAWMRPEELFFLQIQGSGVLTFEDGRRMKALYAANNGRPFVGVAIPMRDRGLLPANDTSGEAIRAWLASHRGAEAQAVMALNPRYIFFRLAPDDGLQPAGAAGAPLPPGRALAVDPTRHAMGQPFWIDADAPTLNGAFPSYRRMAMALDTGGAIKGEVRADLYLGQGARAGAEAGRVKHSLRMWRLTPRSDFAHAQAGWPRS